MPDAARLNVIPRPRESVVLGPAVSIPCAVELVTDGLAADERATISELLHARLEELSIGSAAAKSARAANDCGRVIAGIAGSAPAADAALAAHGLELPGAGGDEAHVLLVDHGGVVVVGRGIRGVHHGIHTLLQLLHRRGDAIMVPRVLVRDWPLMAVRGVSDDVSRGQISTPEDFRSIIRRLAALKVNTYLPYIEDMFAFRAFPEVGAGRAPLTAEEVRDMVDFARRHHVEVVPVFQTLGHQERMLALPRFAGVVEDTARPWCFAPAVEETYDMLRTMLGELAEVFPSPNVLIGCDETYGLGRGRSAAMARRLGVGGVFAHHVARVTGILKKLGRTPWMYADMLFSPDCADGAEGTCRSAVMVNWIYDGAAGYDTRTRRLRDMGCPQIVSPALHCWGRIFPDMAWMRENTDGLLRAGHEWGAIGGIQSSWNDFDGENLREHNWYGYAYGADAMWNPDAADRRWFDAAYFPLFYGTRNGAVRRIHRLLEESNRGFRFYHATTAVALWRDGVDAGTTALIRRRGSLARRLLRIADEVDALLPAARATVARHADHLDLFANCARRIRLLGLRLSGSGSRAEQLALIAAIRAEYETLWLRHNRRPMLDVVLRKYDELAARIRAGTEPGGPGNAPRWRG